jgi:hypothetical protein
MSSFDAPVRTLGLGCVVASVQILGRRAILGGVSLGCGRFLPRTAIVSSKAVTN